jgi:hypothetical protein
MTFNRGVLTVNARPITVTADSLSRFYGEANPGLSWAIGGMGLVTGDTLTGALATPAGAGSDIGLYAITRGTLDAGANYAIAYIGGMLAVTPRAITLAADDLHKLLGQPDPLLTWTITGGSLAPFDRAGSVFSGMVARDPGELPGLYAIGQGTLLANANYAMNFLPGALSIVPRAVTGASLMQRLPPLAASPDQMANADTGEDTLKLCEAGLLPEAACAAYTHPANRDLEQIKFAP